MLKSTAQLAKEKKAAREQADDLATAAGGGGQHLVVMETLIGAAFTVMRDGVRLAVIIAPQDDDGPLMTGG
jgi:hypothetical protein